MMSNDGRVSKQIRSEPCLRIARPRNRTRYRTKFNTYRPVVMLATETNDPVGAKNENELSRMKDNKGAIVKDVKREM